jgi:hypothetical protein
MASSRQPELQVRTAASYVTGSHVFKFGFDDNFGNRDTLEQRNGGYTVSCATGRRPRSPSSRR